MPTHTRLPHTNAQLAAALGYSEWTISMMFRAGCPKDLGGRASLRGVLDWLKTSGFRSTEARAMPALHPRKRKSRPHETAL